MLSLLVTVTLATTLAAGAANGLQAAPPAPQASIPAEAPAPMTGCVSTKPTASGQFTFAEQDGLRRFRLTGKAVRKYAGQRVEILGGGPSGKGLVVKGGLWPPVSGGARGVAQDPAQAAVAIQQAGVGTGGDVPEFRVSKIRVVPGACD
jgi:hypothetical protein